MCTRSHTTGRLQRRAPPPRARPPPLPLRRAKTTTERQPSGPSWVSHVPPSSPTREELPLRPAPILLLRALLPVGESEAHLQAMQASNLKMATTLIHRPLSIFPRAQSLVVIRRRYNHRLAHYRRALLGASRHLCRDQAQATDLLTGSAAGMLRRATVHLHHSRGVRARGLIHPRLTLGHSNPRPRRPPSRSANLTRAWTGW